MIAGEATPLLLTLNEGPNLERTLKKLSWAQTIVIVDSFSTDETLEIARSFSQVLLFQRTFDSFAEQCNFGLEKITSPWVLSLDADYVLSDELVAELASLRPADEVSGFQAGFRYCIGGRPLRASLYPPRTVLYRRAAARYENDGHGHRVDVAGRIDRLVHAIYHDDRKPLGRWLRDQDRYAALEVQKLRDADSSSLSFQDRLRRRAVVAPAIVFVYLLLWRGVILDGWPGWIYVCQRTLAELILSLRLAEARLTSSRPSSDPS